MSETPTKYPPASASNAMKSQAEALRFMNSQFQCRSLHVYFYISDCDLLRFLVFVFFLLLPPSQEHYLSMCKHGGEEQEKVWKAIPRLSMARRSLSHSAGHCLLIPHSQRAEKKRNSRKNCRERVWRAKKKLHSQLELSLRLPPPPTLDARCSPEGKTVFYYFRFSILHNCTFITFLLFPTNHRKRDGDGERLCCWWCWWLVKNHVSQKISIPSPKLGF